MPEKEEEAAVEEGDVPERRKERWQLKKEISVGDILAFATAVSAIFYAYSSLNTRVTVLEDSVHHIEYVEQQYQGRIDQSLRDLNNKLDYVLERGSGSLGMDKK